MIRIDYSFDIETFGVRYDSYIAAIACVKFDIKTGEIKESLYFRTQCRDDQFHIGADTVMWWLSQSEEARKNLAAESVELLSIESALERLVSTFFMMPRFYVWGNGATFDIALLEYAYEKALSAKPPWHFRDVRDMRTIVDVAKCAGFDPSAIEFKGTPHNALHDAEHQARVISGAYRHLIGRAK